MEGGDKSYSLCDIARQQNDSIVSLLVDIQNDTDITRHRVLGFLQNLECLQLTPRRPGREAPAIDVRRQTVDAIQTHRYVALSYTWERSRNERRKKGFY